MVKQLWVTEYDSRTPGMHDAMANDARVDIALAFDLDDRYGPDDFGMIDSNGNIKPSFTAFVQAAKEEPMPDYSQWQGQIGTGLLDMMKDDNTLPAQRKSTFLPLGTNPSDIEEAHGQNGVLYVWHLDGSGSYRFSPGQ